ncbi:MAG: nicotinamide riboside transporter PnuC, partial [Pyrinomonadaceae bacterium]
GRDRAALAVAHAPFRTLGVVSVLSTLGAVGLTLALRSMHGSAPLLDAVTTLLSLAAQYLLNRKFIENWYVWIAADLIYIYLYASKGLHLTAILYFIFLCLCVAGLISWRCAAARQRVLEREGGATGDGRGARLVPHREGARG